MQLIIVILLFILFILLKCVKQKNTYIKVQEKEKKQQLLKMGISQTTNRNLKKLLYFSDKMEQVEKYMKEQGLNRVAIYGMGIIGNLFLEQIKKTDIEICYGIDQADVFADLEVRKPEQIGRDMDIIIVTAEVYYDEIRKMIAPMVDVPIVMLSQIMYEIELFNSYSGER